jgi:hypothetical protein
VIRGGRADVIPRDGGVVHRILNSVRVKEEIIRRGCDEKRLFEAS